MLKIAFTVFSAAAGYAKGIFKEAGYSRVTAQNRNLSVSDVLRLIKGFDLANARGVFGSIYLGLDSLRQAHAAKGDKQRAYDISRFEKVMAGGDFHRKLLAASTLQAICGNYAPLPRLSKWLRGEGRNLPLNEFYHAWHGFMAVPFDHAECFSPFQRLKLDWHTRAIYAELFNVASESYAELTNRHLSSIGDHSQDGKARIAICTTQFLGRRHAPTAAALSIAGVCMQMGHSVKILNQNLTPRAVASGFFAPAVAPKLADLDTVSSLTIEGRSADFWQNTDDEIGIPGVKGFMAALAEFAPTHLISIGPGNLYADLAGRHIPHTAMPSTSDISIGHAGTYANVRPLEPVQQRLQASLGIKPEQVVDIPSGFSRPAFDDSVTRSAFGLTVDDYAVAIVSNRLSQEISPAFFDQLKACLAAHPSLKIIVFGAPASCSEALQAQFSQHPHIRYVGFSKDLFSALSVFDAVLNPPRSGGGTSAAFAMAHGINLFTRPNCDVANVAGPDFTYDDMDAVFAALSKAIGDQAVAEDARTKALRQWDLISDKRRQASILIDAAQKAAA